jgi:hypothetical protein
MVRYSKNSFERSSARPLFRGEAAHQTENLSSNLHRVCVAALVFGSAQKQIDRLQKGSDDRLNSRQGYFGVKSSRSKVVPWISRDSGRTHGGNHRGIRLHNAALRYAWDSHSDRRTHVGAMSVEIGAEAPGQSRHSRAEFVAGADHRFRCRPSHHEMTAMLFSLQREDRPAGSYLRWYSRLSGYLEMQPLDKS